MTVAPVPSSSSVPGSGARDAATAARGLFVTLDGPGGVGKTTISDLLCTALSDRGLRVHRTKQPSPTELGDLIRYGTDTYTGMALACLVAGDRHHQLATEIRPALAAGATVVCDRYLPSSLVLQRIDGLDWDTITTLNACADRPDLAAILHADPALIEQRIGARGGHSRFEKLPDAARIESDLYRETAQRLAADGWPIHNVHATADPAAVAATMLADHVIALLPTEERSYAGRPVPIDVQHRQPLRGTG
jgi:dTMP kinase